MVSCWQLKVNGSYLRLCQLVKRGRDVVKDAVLRSFQEDSVDQEDEEDDVGDQGSEPHDLSEP